MRLTRIDPSRWWRSPLRGPWLTSVFGAALLVGIPIEFITGCISYASYNPRLGANNPNGHVGALHFYLFTWPGGPAWLYRLTQGVHVALGLALVPVVAAKLWSVIPQLFALPPFRSLAHLLERLTLITLVGGIVLELVTGVMNIDYDYGFRFSFYDGHFLGAWIFMASFALHVVLKYPKMRANLRTRSLRRELRTPLSATVQEEGPDSGLVATHPAPATISRRGALALVGAGSAAVVIATAGQTVGGWTRRVALLAPRGLPTGSGPDAFPVNRTAAAAGITPDATGASWRLTLAGATTAVLSRSELMAMDRISADLPIACVEGWSTTQRWSGVRLRALAALVGVDHPVGAVVESIQRGSPYARVTLSADQVVADDALLALQVNGADLTADHGYPARTMIPAAPGVHQTKWVQRITFLGPAS